MARRVILDTGVIIAFERGQLDIDAVLGADDAAIASITAMELLVGVERANRCSTGSGVRCMWRPSYPVCPLWTTHPMWHGFTLDSSAKP